MRGVWFTPYGFKSRFSHHSHSIKMQLCQKSLATQGFFDFLKVSKHPFSTVQLFPSKRDLNPRHFGKIEKIVFFDIINTVNQKARMCMKNGYTMVRRLKLTPFELRIIIDALNAKRLKQKANGMDNRETSNLILYLLDVLEA